MPGTTCARCSKPLPELAVKNGDPYDSRKCAEADHGLSMAADLKHGLRDVGDITPMRTLGGAALAVTRLQREAVARDLEARARVSREDRAGRYSRLEDGQ